MIQTLASPRVHHVGHGRIPHVQNLWLAYHPMTIQQSKRSRAVALLGGDGDGLHLMIGGVIIGSVPVYVRPVSIGVQSSQAS